MKGYDYLQAGAHIKNLAKWVEDKENPENIIRKNR